MPKTRPWSEIGDKIAADPVRRARMEEYGRAMEDVLALAQLRTELGLPEYEVDEDVEDAQPADSRVEHNEDRYVATLRSYLEAMGGRLEINAVFPDGTLTLLPGRRWAVPDAGEEHQFDTGPNRAAASQADSERTPVGAARPSRRRG